MINLYSYIEFLSFRKAIMLIGGFFVMSCGPKAEKLETYNNDIDMSKDMAYNVKIILSQQAKTQTQITAPLMVRNEKIIPAFAEMPNGLHADFYNDSGQVTTNLVADYARYYERQQNVILQRNVIVTNADSTILKTEELIWNNELERFFTEKPVHITRQGQVITGTGLEANKDLTEIKILQQRSVIPMTDTSSGSRFSIPNPSTTPGSGTSSTSADTLRRNRPTAPHLNI